MAENARVTVVPPSSPPISRLAALADRCVQCGLCLPACPTYRLDALEAESPRGRIALAKAWELELVAPTAAGDAHLDHCLGCRRCEAVCPAGVEYGQLLVDARSAQRHRRAPGWRQRAIEALAARPGRMRAVLALYRALYPLLPAQLRPLPRPPRAGRASDTPIPASHTLSEHADLFVGCVARSYEGPTRAALAKLCAAVGVTLRIPTTQTCCGSLHAHAGNDDTAEHLGRRNRDAFAEGGGRVLTLASGCHEAVAQALGGRAVDALDFLAARAERLRFVPCRERIALHLPCSQRNVVGSDAALHALLARVPGIEIVPLDAGFGCCGAAGSAMLNDPSRAARFRQPLLDTLASSGAGRVLSANIGCRLHLGNGSAVPVQHPLEFLAECLVLQAHDDQRPLTP